MRTSTKSFIAIAAVLLLAVLLIARPFDSDAGAESLSTGAPTSTTTTTDPGPTAAEVRELNVAIWVAKTNERTWNDELARQEAERQAEADRQAEIARQAEADRQAELARQEAAEAAAATTTPAPSNPAPVAEQGTGRCGGDLPPCYVMERESGGNIHAQNPSSTASGKWQFLDSTWAGFGGYAKARYAPESVQDAKARQLWAGGAGCSHWNAC